MVNDIFTWIIVYIVHIEKNRSIGFYRMLNLFDATIGLPCPVAPMQLPTQQNQFHNLINEFITDRTIR